MSVSDAPINSAAEATVDLAGLDLERHARLGFILLGVLAVLFLGWGVFAPLSGAVVAPGRVVLESSVKRIQHKEGGIVSDLFVKEGDRVKTGTLLARIDATVPQANMAVIRNQFEELTARRLRLIAERDRRGSIPDSALATAPKTAEFKVILAAERRLLAERRSLKQQKRSQLTHQTTQLRQEIEGLQTQLTSQAAQRALIDKELTGVRQLYEKGLTTLPRLNGLEREARRLEGADGQLLASIAEARTRISQLEVQALQLDSEDLTQVMTELKETEIKLAQLSEQRTTGEDALRRVDVRAPTDGQVQQLSVHTRGGVVGAGETLMLVVPERDEMVIEAHIDPSNIDQVSPGRAAKVRFTAFAAPSTPVLDAKVDSLSTDVQAEERTGRAYYVARLNVDSPRLKSGVRSRLVAGMPAEVQIATGSRNALSYFLKPLSDQLARTFREE